MKKSKLVLACEKAAELANQHSAAIAKAVELFERKYGEEPHMDSAFMGWVHYAETPTDIEKMNEVQG